VIVEAGDDVGAAADERLKGFRAALKVLDFDVQPFVLIEAQFARERRR